MAQKSDKTTIRRIKATDDAPTQKATHKTPTPAAQSTPTKKKKPTPRRTASTRSPGGYFKGAWAELKLVRWPTRRATWGMTFAVIVFTFIFVVFILLLDAGFRALFESILK